MNYKTAADFRAALDERLRNESERNGIALTRLRKIVAFDRFLARLVIAAPDRWVLKGGLALQVRLGLQTRMTKDIDLARADDEAAATEDFIAVQNVHLADYFEFSIERSGVSDDVPGSSSTRYRVRAELAGRVFEEFPVDVAFVGLPFDTPEMMAGENFLGFAGIEPATVPVLPAGQHVAEKVHAYTRKYGADAAASTRPKDLIDIVLVSLETTVDAADLRAALVQTFRERGTHELPATLPRPPESWTASYATSAASVGLPPEIANGYSTAATFVDPVLSGRSSGRWNPLIRTWTDE